MISGHFKTVLNQFWDRIGRLVARSGVHPNTITVGGTLVITMICMWYVYSKHTVTFGVILLVFGHVDFLDGAVARVTGKKSKYGAFLDSVLDRYQEAVVFLAVAYVTDYWMLCYLCLAGSMFTSYIKARTGMEIEISNEDWPDLMERVERGWLLCAGLIFSGFEITILTRTFSILYLVLCAFAVGVHVTAMQRFQRAKNRIKTAEDASQS